MNIRKITTAALPLIAALLLLTSCNTGGQRSLTVATVGQPAPDFALTDLNGRQWQLSELRGKVVFINFWATWCPPCIKELPSMDSLNKRMAGKPFQMLTILFNDQAQLAQSLVNKAGYKFPVLIDPSSETGNQYGLTGVPETYIVDPQGILQEKFIGPAKWDSPEALQLIQQYLPR